MHAIPVFHRRTKRFGEEIDDGLDVPFLVGGEISHCSFQPLRPPLRSVCPPKRATPETHRRAATAAREIPAAFRRRFRSTQEHPLVDPHVSHLRQVPLRTSVKLP